jgi:hypothetical protein
VKILELLYRRKLDNQNIEGENRGMLREYLKEKFLGLCPFQGLQALGLGGVTSTVIVRVTHLVRNDFYV